MHVKSLLARLAKDQQGTSSVEYGLILAMIVLAMFSALSGFANSIQNTWNNVSTQSANAVNQSNPAA